MSVQKHWQNFQKGVFLCFYIKHTVDINAYCTSTMQNERLRSCTCTTRCYCNVFSNRKIRSTAKRTFSQL